VHSLLLNGTAYGQVQHAYCCLSCPVLCCSQPDMPGHPTRAHQQRQLPQQLCRHASRQQLCGGVQQWLQWITHSGVCGQPELFHWSFLVISSHRGMQRRWGRMESCQDALLYVLLHDDLVQGTLKLPCMKELASSCHVANCNSS
jgi:hypothetical protein